MKAGVWSGPGQLNCEEWPEPRMRDTDVRIDVAYCGMCGSDIHIVEGTLPIGDPPQVLGHEVSGVITEVGSRVRGLEPGMPVACNFFGGCGACRLCRRGFPNMCARKYFGANGYAEQAVYRADLVFALRSGTDLQRAALLEPLATALYAVECANLPPGAQVLVIGAGTVGLLTALMALHRGASSVTISEPQRAKRTLALALGVTHAWDPADDQRTLTAEVTHGAGFDTVFDAAGVAKATEGAIDLLAPGGTLMITAVHAIDVTLPVHPYELYQRQLTVTSAFANVNVFERALDLLPRVDVDPIITAVKPIEEISDAYAQYRAGAFTKVLIDPRN